MVNRRYVIPDVYVNEIDKSNDEVVNNTTIGLAFAGVFKKGKIGLNLINSLNDIKEVLGDGNPTSLQNPNIKQDWHAVKQLLNASRDLKISRSITTVDKTAYHLSNLASETQTLHKVIITGKKYYLTKDNIVGFDSTIGTNVAFYDSYIDGDNTIIRFLADETVALVTPTITFKMKFTNSELRTYLDVFVNKQYAISTEDMLNITIDTEALSRSVDGSTGLVDFTIVTPKVLKVDSIDFFTNVGEMFYIGISGTGVLDDLSETTANSTIENVITQVEVVGLEATFTTDVEHLGVTLSGVYHEDDEHFKSNYTFGVGNDLLIVAKNLGSWGNDISVNIYGSKFLNSVEGKNISSEYNYRTFLTTEMVIDVNLTGSTSERFLVNTDATAKDDNGQLYFLEDVINKGSKFISIFKSEASDFIPADMFHNIELSGGIDSTTQTINNLTEAYSVFEDKNISVPYVLSGGTFLSETDLNTLNQFIETNILEGKFRLGEFNTPFSLLSNADIGQANDEWAELGFFMSDTTGSYHVSSTYVKVQDYKNSGTVTIPVNMVTIENRCKNAQSNGEWNAVMGETVGLLGNFLEVVYVPKSNDDLIIFNQKNLNPVVFDEEVGYYIQNDNTFLKSGSSFRDTDVRLLFYKLESEIARISRRFIGKKNTPENRAELKSLINDYFVGLPSDAVEEYSIICDTSNNTQAKIDANIIVADIGVKPYRTGKFVELNFTNEG